MDETAESYLNFPRLMYNDDSLHLHIKCSNQIMWSIAQDRVLFKEKGVLYTHADLDKAAGIFSQRYYYKHMIITFRDTPDNIEHLIEHPNIWIVSVRQLPLYDKASNPPTAFIKGDKSSPRRGCTYMTSSEDEDKKNWVNRHYAEQQYTFSEDQPDLYDYSYLRAPTSKKKNFPTTIGYCYRNLDDLDMDNIPDIVNPDERFYEVNMEISNDYYISSAALEDQLFKGIIMNNHLKGNHRMFLDCAQFLEALDMLEKHYKKLRKEGFVGVDYGLFKNKIPKNYGNLIL